ncbi:MAG: lipid-A-disaccharide synthase [Prevotellaceae bacterium]|jgi:lipid-A-disaccharide synthase|nr:lipid-A-disaccharide synthase [Prevotellaceae bacterium]
MKYYIIAGEASGDLHGGDLIKGLKQADPQAEIRAWGGDRMAAHGVALVKHYKDAAVMGFVEVLRHLPKVLRNIRFCKRDILAFRPDAVILIDYPGFNFRIARFAKKNGLKVFYYIAPKVWAWKERRVKRLQRDVHKLFIIFPFEKAYFKRWGIDAFYAGNPLVDTVNERLKDAEPAAVFRQRNRLSGKPIIAVLPGSRRMEINYILPRVTPLAERFPDYQFVVAGAPATDRQAYEKHLRHTAVQLVANQTCELLSHAAAAIVASGTATLETALIGTPQIVCYGGNEISFQIAKRLVRIKFISLVNIIMNREVVRELLQHDLNAANLQAGLHALLPSGNKRAAQLNDYAELRRRLGEQGAAKRIAEEMAREVKRQAPAVGRRGRTHRRR